MVDATCGNGYDTLAMVKMVADESGSGHVYAMDVQKEALESTSVLLDESLSEKEVSFSLSHFRGIHDLLLVHIQPITCSNLWPTAQNCNYDGFI